MLLPCVSLWSLMPIFANGDVPMCNIDYGCNHKIGNIFNNSIKEVWNSNEMKLIRNNHLNARKNKISMCKNCNVWEEVKQRDGAKTVSEEYLPILSKA